MKNEFIPASQVAANELSDMIFYKKYINLTKNYQTSMSFPPNWA
ncbi:hypothetical protein [Anaerotignum propionicum]|nr:hypothetical protein [Anaerotignum propionicum]